MIHVPGLPREATESTGKHGYGTGQDSVWLLRESARISCLTDPFLGSSDNDAVPVQIGRTKIMRVLYGTLITCIWALSPSTERSAAKRQATQRTE